MYLKVLSTALKDHQLKKQSKKQWNYARFAELIINWQLEGLNCRFSQKEPASIIMRIGCIGSTKASDGSSRTVSYTDAISLVGYQAEVHVEEELLLNKVPIKVESKVNPFLEKLVGLEFVGKDEEAVSINVDVGIDLSCWMTSPQYQVEDYLITTTFENQATIDWILHSLSFVSTTKRMSSVMKNPIYASQCTYLEKS